MKGSTKITIVLTLVFVAVGFLCFRPIINPQLEDCLIEKGRLKSVSINSDNKDIYFTLEENEKNYRLNRGLDKGINQEVLDSLIGEIVTVYPVNHWTLLDPDQKNPHVARMEAKGSVIYSEF